MVEQKSKNKKPVKAKEKVVETNSKIKKEEKVSKTNEVKNTSAKQAPKVENKKSIKVIKTIWNITFWTVISCLLAIWIVDFVRVKNEEKPVFCVKEVNHKYKDGTTKEYFGLGYKVYYYDRTSIKVKTQFTPFFVGMEK